MLLQPSVGVAIVAYAAVIGEDVHNWGIRSKVSFMRSEIVFELLRTTNRFALCHLAFKAIHKLHNPSNRIQDTVNDALRRLAGAERQQVGMESANAIENKQKQSAIASHAGAPSAKPLAEAVDRGNASVIFPAESPESQWELIVRSA